MMKVATQAIGAALLCFGLMASAQDDAESETDAQAEAPPSAEVREEDEEFIPSREVPAAEEVVFPVDI